MHLFSWPQCKLSCLWRLVLPRTWMQLCACKAFQTSSAPSRTWGHGRQRVTAAGPAQGLPPGWTQACYPVLPPGVTSHRALPRRVDDGDRLEVRAGRRSAVRRSQSFPDTLCVQHGVE